MKKTAKKILSLIMTCLLVFQGMSVIAVEAVEASDASVSGGTLTVGSATATVGDKLSIDVVFENNPGMNAMSLAPVYDESLLRLDAIKMGEGIWANGVAIRKYVWSNMSRDAYDGGVVISLEFTVLDSASLTDATAPVNTTVSLIYDGCNYAEERPPVTVIDGTVTITPKGAGALIVGSGNYISGDTIELPVVMKNNPGVCSLILAPVYDSSVLELVQIKTGEGVFADAETATRYVWVDIGGDVTDDGTVFTLVFKVRDSAPHGKTEVSVIYDGSNKQEEMPVIIPIPGVSMIHNAADIVTGAATSPTCTESGLTEGKYCAFCREVFVKQELIPATGHDFDAEYTIDIEATTEAPGQKSRHCRNCSEVTDVTEIPMLSNIKGDINGSGAVDTKDLTRLMKYIAGSDVVAYGPDLTGNGIVDTKDLSRLMKFLAGFEV